jgi:hypothetical protein
VEAEPWRILILFYRLSKLRITGLGKTNKKPVPLHSRLWVIPVQPAEFNEEENEMAKRGSQKAAAKIKD